MTGTWNYKSNSALLLFSVLIVFLSFYLQYDLFLNLADEGYLWYGTWRMAEGDIPILDFQSYDPGRYIWGAFWFELFNDSYITLRASNAVFQLIGLFLGLLLVRRINGNWLFVISFAAILMLWMWPRFRYFEHTIAIAVVYFGVLLLEKPSLQRHLIAGVFVGLAAFFGRNHGLYGFIIIISLILYSWSRQDKNQLAKKLLYWGVGIFIGYSPMIIMILSIPGYLSAFVDSILDLIRLGATNIPLDIIWPWLFWENNYPVVGFIVTLKLMLKNEASFIGFVLFFWILFVAISILYLLISKKQFLPRNAVMVSAIAAAIPYLHFAISRADIYHLADSIYPLLIAVAALPSFFQQRARVFSSVLVIVILAVATVHIGKRNYYYKFATAKEGSVIQGNIQGSNIWLDDRTLNILKSIQDIDSNYVPEDEGFLIIPYLPTMYAALGRKSPIKEIYLLHGTVESKELDMISQLKEHQVNWAIVNNRLLDGRENMRLSNQYPLLWEHLQITFDEIHESGLPSGFTLLKRRDS